MPWNYPRVPLGSVTVKVVPFPWLVVKAILPPWATHPKITLKYVTYNIF
jgi:hypothetical protein